jgi:hypothetical protein
MEELFFVMLGLLMVAFGLFFGFVLPEAIYRNQSEKIKNKFPKIGD